MHPDHWIDSADAAPVEDALYVGVVDELAKDPVRVLEVAIAVVLQAGADGWDDEEGQDGGGEGLEELHCWSVLVVDVVWWYCADVTYFCRSDLPF